MNFNTITNRHHSTALVAVVLIAVSVVAGCCRDAPAPDSTVLELKSYSIEPERGEELRSMIGSVLTRGEEKVGKVSLISGGLLAVLAPRDIQGGIQDLIALATEITPPGPPELIDLRVWAVTGTGSVERGADQVPGLQSLEPALRAIMAEQGPTSFSLMESLRLSTLSGEQGEVTGRHLRVTQQAAVVDGRVVAEIRIQNMGGRSGLNTRLAASPGELVVLAESGLEGPAGGSSLYYIVRAEIIGEAG